MYCRICKSLTKKCFETKLLKYNVSFYLCDNCKFLQSEEPYWIEEAYSNSISILDTGIFERNLDLIPKILLILSYKKMIKNNIFRKILGKKQKVILNKFSEKLLDFGGGYGIFVRMLRDKGINAFWTDKYSKNLFAKGFEEDNNQKYTVITAFELFEHLVQPKQEITQILNKYKPKIFIFSTLLYGDTIPTKDWWYYSFETGQHISFYSHKTLLYLAKLNNVNYYSIDENLHIFSNDEIIIEELIYFLNNKDYYMNQIISLYNSLTFSDHHIIKNNIGELK